MVLITDSNEHFTQFKFTLFPRDTLSVLDLGYAVQFLSLVNLRHKSSKLTHKSDNAIMFPLSTNYVSNIKFTNAIPF